MVFLAEAREYLTGKFRRRETISGREVARLILSFAKLVPSCVKRVIVRMDAEMYSWAAVKAYLRLGYEFIISVKRTRPPFDPKGWYSVGRDKEIQYNHAIHSEKSEIATSLTLLAMTINNFPVIPRW